MSASGLTTHHLVNEPFEVDPTGITTKTVQSYWLTPPGTWVLVDLRMVRDPANARFGGRGGSRC